MMLPVAKLNFFPITVGGQSHSICCATYFHMPCNNKEANKKLANDLKCDMLYVGFLFCDSQIKLFNAIIQNWLELLPNAGGDHKFMFL